MDDDFKEYRRGKPQRQLYKPGSGPLKKSSYGFDSKMNSYDVPAGHKAREHYGSRNSIYDGDSSNKEQQSMTNNRHKRPEQPHYTARSGEGKPADERHLNASLRCDNSSQSFNRRRNDKHGYSNSGPRGGRRNSKDGSNDINYNRNYRQVSEPRAVSPAHSARDSSVIDRNRDSRSMETSAGRHNQGSVGKPPSGRRNSAGYSSDSPRPKYMLNFENLPPRLRKKFLEQSGHHSVDSVDYLNKDRPVSNHSGYNQGHYNSASGWSQTLPSRGRGRLRDNEHFDREKFLNSYLKNYDSRRSTPSNSYLNLYEASAENNIHLPHSENVQNHNNIYNYESKNGMSHSSEKCAFDNQDEEHSKQESDSEAISYSSMNLADMANLDWTEEVEKDAKLEEMCDSTTSSPSLNIKTPSISQDIRPVENKFNEPREPKRRSRIRDKRSSSRGQRNEKKPDRNRRDSGQQESMSNIQQRERKDSHRSNRSSTIGNSRDDLDRWRSLRSFSREHSTEGRIVSQCNSRDTSANRALSPRDNDGFRVPSAVPKNNNWNSNNQKKNNGSWGGSGGGGGRPGSTERGRQSPAPSGAGEGPPEGSGRRSKKRSGRRRGGGGKNSENAAPAVQSAAPAHAAVNWRDEILSKKHSLQDRLDRHQEVNRNRLNSCQSDKSESSSHPGLLILPQGAAPQPQNDRVREGSADVQKTLFDHHNPSKPIIVQTSSSKMDTRMDRGSSMSWARAMGAEPAVVGAVVGAGAGAGEAARAARHRSLLMEVDRADAILQTHSLRGPLSLAAHWGDVAETRKFLQGALERLLLSDLKYCQADNVEHRFWKILYYNFIEVLRKSISQSTPEDKQRIVKLINMIIEEGNVYFENLVHLLEKTYKFNTEDYINGDHVLPPKGMGYVGLAMISVQKMYVFLGDLARYSQQVNETNNYAKSKFWYTKAQQINPKNGRPYNQLAILAIYARRKLDAVYYYMRSLMSSNPFHSARESLLSLFDENRKKYEAAERKRRAVLEANDNLDGHEWSQPSRREVWVRWGGGGRATEPGDDGLAAMTPVELNKNFITSYLHVHGKLVTKIGMETFHESAAKMLRQFRALLHQQPLPTPPARLLQLTALNMFAVECTSTQPDSDGSRSTWLECAVGVSLLMFGALLERCCALLPEPAASQHHADALLLLPAIKVWSDWMLCHSSKWNPPPSLDQFEMGNDNDPWDWLAKLMNILEALDDKSVVFENEMQEGYESVRLAEDAALAGFTPLMYMEPAAAFMRGGGAGGGAGGAGGAGGSGGGGALPPHLAEHALRTRKLLFFGTEYLVGVEPPVLKLEYPADAAPRYVSAVQRAAPRPELHHLSEDEEEEITAQEREVSSTNGKAVSGEVPETDEATRRLLRRKEQLESRRASLERRKLRVQELLKSGARVEVEVRPRWLVPDTNCFIDQLALLRRCVEPPGAGPLTLAVPLVVITELEGLRKCSRVGAQAATALEWLSPAPPGVKFATSRGSLLSSRAFTAEQEQNRATNDDRVLATALNLHANVATEPDVDGEIAESSTAGAGVGASGAAGAGCVRRLREVVLLTDDRNLRVKALAAELPVRDLPSFVAWAGFKGPSSQDEENKTKAV